MLNTLDTIQVSTASLEERFADKLKINRLLTRQLVSFQGNKDKPGYRWFKYKEGFSEGLIQYLLDYVGLDEGILLDPFAGTGTALFAARERGMDAVGIELLPLGSEIIEVRKLAFSEERSSLRAVIDRWREVQPWRDAIPSRSFPHLRITEGAFSQENQHNLEKYLSALANEDKKAARLLRFAALCILEEMSYTRKDGQYLRWDYRSGRRQGKKQFDKGPIATFDEAILQKLEEIAEDLKLENGNLGLFSYGEIKGQVDVVEGSCLKELPTLDSASFDGIVTSPPYCNRYDYTRTYALELAMLGVDEMPLRQLRQAMVSCTVENREKTGLESVFSPKAYDQALAAFDRQEQLHQILAYLEGLKSAKALNNAGIPRMVRNYFFEMALVIFETARVLKPGAPFVMVNDNVRYGGVAIPVDLILSDFAEQAGFEVEVIWVLPRGKGNSSQQMGAHGREELRKCIYIWRRGDR